MISKTCTGTVLLNRLEQFLIEEEKPANSTHCSATKKQIHSFLENCEYLEPAPDQKQRLLSIIQRKYPEEGLDIVTHLGLQSLAMLPSEIHKKIMEFLPLEGLIALKQTSKVFKVQFHAEIQERLNHNLLKVKSLFTTETLLAYLTNRGDQIEALDLHDMDITATQMNSILASCPNLNYLISSRKLKVLSNSIEKYGSQITGLNLNYSYPSSLMTSILGGCPNLQRVTLNGFDKFDGCEKNILDWLQKYGSQILDLTVECIEDFTMVSAILAACSNLRSLRLGLNRCDLTHLDLTHCPYLEKLEISAMSRFTVTGSPQLREFIARGCPGVVKIDMSASPFLTLVDCSGCWSLTHLLIQDSSNLQTCLVKGCSDLIKLDLSNLHALKMVDCRNCDKLVEINLSRSQKLEYLYAGDCEALQELELADLPHLVMLECNNCVALTKLHLSNNPSLSFVECSGCIQLTDLKLQECLGLRTFVASFCSALTTLNLSDHPLLADVDCRECFELSSFSIERCPQLEMLNVQCCSKLQELVLTDHPALIFFMCDGCEKLEKCVVEGCPKLEYVSATYCDTLKSIDLADAPLLTFVAM